MRVKFFSVFLDLIFPPKCVFCHGIALSGRKICEKCEKEILHTVAKKCISIPDSGETILCIAPYPYSGKVRESIIRFKFYGQRELANFYAEDMAGQIRKCCPDARFDAVTSVPISAERYRSRGYNQSELLAKSVAHLLRLPFHEYLVKIKDNREQHKLSERERRGNVQGVYLPKDGGQLSGKSILLIDDIVTTGATLGECTSVLLQSGAKQVTCAAAAHVL
ncbi:ComF family protein [Caproiciproducens sp.]|uniref:ComF family protein n=1 Tax=Caproiciproducens sp. TaxID=1954376 RepID=UPI002898C753|nr:ComF family protein [Caproiciproducens sp.]